MPMTLVRSPAQAPAPLRPLPRGRGLQPRPPSVLAALLVALCCSGAADARRPRLEVALQVGSTPPGALVSVHRTATPAESGPRTVAGTTPLATTLDLGEERRLWLELERRGFRPQMVEIGPESSSLHVELTPVVGEVAGAPSKGGPLRIAVLEPELTVIRRGFAHESVDEEASRALGLALAAAVRGILAERGAELVADHAGVAPKALWRDARTAMRMLDPVRLPYLSEAPRLETRSGRNAAAAVGDQIGADALLLVTGKENLETGGMKVGKVGLSVAGTAASYGSAHSAASARGDSFFVYNVFVPTFAQGLVVQALLVDVASGEVRWLDGGLWRPVSPADTESLTALAADLLAGLEPVANEPEPSTPKETP